MKISEIRIFLIIYTIVLSCNFLLLFGDGNKPVQEASIFRFIISSLMIFVMPGMIWGEILKFKSRHILQTISLSFAITLSIETLFLILVLALDSKIGVWLILLLSTSFAGVVILFLKKDYQPTFVKSIWDFYKAEMPFKVSIPVIALLLIVISAVLYRWSENIFAIDGEKLLHLTYIRYYSTMNLNISDLGIYRGMPPLNIIHLWEFIVAGWAKLSNIDALIVFSHARAVIPIIGFSSLYLLISNIFSNRLKSEFIIWSIVIMCLGWFAILSPSSLDWVKEDPFRGLMSFMGTAHHADTAMEILIPLLSAVGLITVRKPLLKNYMLLAFLLTGAFMWHTREFFQTAIYLAITALTIFLVIRTDKRKVFKTLLVIAVIFLGIAILFYIAMNFFASKQQHGYDEFKLKEIALAYGLQNMFDIRSPFHFPNDVRLTMGLNKDAILPLQQIAEYVKQSWNFYLWLILSAFAVVLLIFLGRKEDRHFAIFYLLLWFFAFCWGFSQFMLIVLTYSEINFTLPRMIYIFSYISIGAGMYILFQRFENKCANLQGMIIVLVGFFICGLIFMLWWRFETPLAKYLSYLFAIIFPISFIASFYPRLSEGGLLKKTEFFPGLLAVFLFFAPILAQDYVKFISKSILESNKGLNWFEKDNPTGMSVGLIEVLRKIEHKKVVLVNPFGTTFVSLYAPLYYPVVPEIMGKTLVTASETYNRIRQEGHPLFYLKDGLSYEINEDRISLKPDFIANFANIQNGTSVENNIVKIASPMVLHSRQGDFIFEKKDKAIRVSPVKGKSNTPLFISFGYALGDQGFNLNVKPNDELLFMVSARISGGKALVFLLDVANGQQEESKIDISGNIMKSYSVGKKLRTGLQAVSMGIQWQPKNDSDYIEFKDVRVYKSDDINRHIKGAVSVVNHKKVKEWLTKNKVDYVLINDKDYDRLISYFIENSSDFHTVFHNKETKELLLKVKK